MNYEKRRARAFRNLRVYVVGAIVFTAANIVAIVVIDGYSFPKNFWAIWPILGWGIPTLWRILELRRFKNGETDAHM